MVVPADPGLSGGQHVVVHRAQHAQNSGGSEGLQREYPRAKPSVLSPQGRRFAGGTGRGRSATHWQHAGQWRLEGETAAAGFGQGRGSGLDGGGQGGRGQQDRLHRRAQCHRAGVHRGAARLRPDRARTDVAQRQIHLCGRRHDCRRAPRAPPERQQPDVPGQPAGE